MTETASDITDDGPALPALRNPRPRPALRFEGEENWVVAARPLPGQTDADAEDQQTLEAETEGKRQRKAKVETKEEKRKKSGKNRRRKAEKKRPKEVPEISGSAARDRDARSLTLTLPEEFRKALDRAAAEHGLSSEGLAAFVLVEWLDR